MRAFTDDKGNPWFVAKDVCEILELRPHNGSYTNNLRILEVNEITYAKTLGIKLSGSGQFKLTFISESGLYKLIMRSNKPQAKPFQNWVTQVVLPA